MIRSVSPAGPRAPLATRDREPENRDAARVRLSAEMRTPHVRSANGSGGKAAHAARLRASLGARHRRAREGRAIAGHRRTRRRVRVSVPQDLPRGHAERREEAGSWDQRHPRRRAEPRCRPLPRAISPARLPAHDGESDSHGLSSVVPCISRLRCSKTLRAQFARPADPSSRQRPGFETTGTLTRGRRWDRYVEADRLAAVSSTWPSRAGRSDLDR